MYIIGLIDDEESQLKKIRRTIKTNAKMVEPYDFKSYLIPDKASNVVSDIFEEIINDIRALKLSSLIVDYKIIHDFTTFINDTLAVELAVLRHS